MNYLDVMQGQWNFPSRDVSEAKKDEPLYNLQYSQAMYNRYLNEIDNRLKAKKEK